VNVRISWVSGIVLALGAPLVVYAACTGPANAGTAFYNGTYKVLQYCDGTNWKNLGSKNQGGGSGPCSTPTGAEGAMIYNSTTNVLQYCNGDNWVNMGNSNAGATGSCSTPTGNRGAVFFNTTVSKLQYCNGTAWINAGNWVAGSPAPACSGSYTWTDRTASGSRKWNGVASSSDGSKLAAVVYTGNLYTSTDSGATWTAQTAAGSRTWQGIA
jgi:hypothetical protein